MHEGRSAGPWEDLDDPRMWRLILARLHPDAGGDQELFAFACAVKDEVCRGRPPVRGAAGARSEPRARRWERRAADTFLEDWQYAMRHWSSRNHEVLRSFRYR